MPGKDAINGRGEIMDVLELIAFFNAELGESVSSEESEKKDMTDYLKREDKIFSLLREKKRRQFHLSLVMEAVNVKKFASAVQKSNADAMAYLLSAISKLAVERLNSGDDSFLELLGEFKDVVKICPMAEFEGDDRLLRASLRRGEKLSNGKSVIVPLERRLESDPMDLSHLLLDPNGRITASRNGRGLRLATDKQYRYCCNPDVFSVIILLAYMRKHVRSDMEENGEESVLFQKLCRMQENCIENNRKINNGTVFIHDGSCKGYIQDYMEKNDFDYSKRVVDLTSYRYILQEADFIPAFLMAEKIEKTDLVLSMVSMSILTKNYRWKVRRFLSLCGCVWEDAYSSVMVDILSEILTDYEQEKQSEEYERQLAGDYASVWETKKNIPEKVLVAMAESSFNDTFGFVEFDEECDLEKLRKLEKEWDAIKKLLGIGSYQNVSIRFRKLGNHKAAGLYFPFLQCLCVDVRCPSSMVHEVFHMLDYQEGRRSSKYSFLAIKERYSHCLKESLGRLPEATRKKLEGKSKYNLAYYLTPTEIFARCGEIYMVRVLGVDNSLVKPEEDFAYPKDEQLEKLIAEYFNEMIKERRDAV